MGRYVDIVPTYKTGLNPGSSASNMNLIDEFKFKLCFRISKEMGSTNICREIHTATCMYCT